MEFFAICYCFKWANCSPGKPGTVDFCREFKFLSACRIMGRVALQL